MEGNDEVMIVIEMSQRLLKPFEVMISLVNVTAKGKWLAINCHDCH